MRPPIPRLSQHTLLYQSTIAFPSSSGASQSREPVPDSWSNLGRERMWRPTSYFGNQKPLRLKVIIDHFKQYHYQFVPLQKMTEVQYCGFIRRGIGNPSESRKVPHVLDLLQNIFHLPVK